MTKVHHKARRFAADDYDILLIGHEGHAEVEGTSGEAPGHIQLVQGPDDVPGIVVRDPEKVAWLSQTTLSSTRRWRRSRRSGAVPAVARPAQRRHLLRHPEPAARDQGDQRRSRPGDRRRLGNSSNSVRLAEVALEAGAKAAHRVDDASEIDETWLEGVDCVSVTSGASVPDDLVAGVLRLLTERGYPDAQAVHTAEESLIFALAPELRRDLRAAAAQRAVDIVARYVDVHPVDPQPRAIA